MNHRTIASLSIRCATLRQDTSLRDDDLTLPFLITMGSGAGEETAVVFVHDTTGMVTTYKHIAARLVGNPTYGIACGAAPSDVGTDAHIARYVDILNSMDAPAVVLVGWSFGGSLAVEIASMDSRRLAPRVRGLCLLDTAPASWASARQLRQDGSPHGPVEGLMLDTLSPAALGLDPRLVLPETEDLLELARVHREYASLRLPRAGNQYGGPTRYYGAALQGDLLARFSEATEMVPAAQLVALRADHFTILDEEFASQIAADIKAELLSRSDDDSSLARGDE